jgi:beta-1,2-xylosyltransferase
MIRATFTIHDQPTMLLDYKRQQELLTAAKDHTGEFTYSCQDL